MAAASQYLARCRELWMWQSAKLHALLYVGTAVATSALQHLTRLQLAAFARSLLGARLWASSFVVYMSAVFPVLVWRQRQYGRAATAPPLLSWALLVFANGASLLSYSVHAASAWLLSRQFLGALGMTALTDPLLPGNPPTAYLNPSLVRHCGILLLTVLATQTSHLLFPNSRPQFSTARGLRRFWTSDNLLRELLNCCRTALTIVSAMWMPQLLGFHTLYRLVCGVANILVIGTSIVPLEIGWLASFRRFLSPVDLAASVVCITATLFVWKVAAYIQQIFLTQPIIASSSTQELIQAMQTTARPVVQHYLYQELAIVSTQVPFRREAIFRDQVDTGSWTDISQLCLDRIVGLSNSIDTEFRRSPNAEAKVPVLVPRTAMQPAVPVTRSDDKVQPKVISTMTLDPNEPSPASLLLPKRSKTWPLMRYVMPFYRVAKAVYTAIMAEYRGPPAPARAPPQRRVVVSGDARPLVPRFDQDSRTSAHASSNNSTPVELVPLQSDPLPPPPQPAWQKKFEERVRQPVLKWWRESLYHAAVRDFFLKIRLTYLFVDYQLVFWSVQALSSLIVYSRSEDPYGTVYKSIPTVVTALFQLREQLLALQTNTRFLGWPTRHLGLLLPRHRTLPSLNKSSLFRGDPTRRPVVQPAQQDAGTDTDGDAPISHLASEEELSGLLDRMEDGIPRKAVILYDAIDCALYQIACYFHSYLSKDGVAKVSKQYQPLLRQYLEKTRAA
ncbi:Nuclear pore complex subunit [Sorochytrium milnesiophthora]